MKPSLVILLGVSGTTAAKILTQENAAIFAGFATGVFMFAQTVKLFFPSNKKQK